MAEVIRPILERYRRLLSSSEFEQLTNAVERPLPPTLRVNTLKIGIEEARRTWPDWYGWNVQPVSFCPTGWQITDGGEELSRTLEHRMGFYYIQDAASMLPAEMFDFEGLARPLILDMAASPGGKTTHLCGKIGDSGLIVANDTSQARIGALRSNLQDWGAIGVAITNFPGERFGGWFPEMFDMALLDAPCSGESLRTAERRKTRPVSAKERQQLQQRQVRLLTSALQAVKPGGQVVYATCTLAPEEDEAVVDAVLKTFPRQVTVENAGHILPIPAPGLTSDGSHPFDPQLQRAVRLWPHLYDTSGFFAALIRKTDSVEVAPQEKPRRSRAQSGLEEVPRAERTRIVSQLQQDYGFDLQALIEGQMLALWRRGKSVYAVPQQFLTHFADLPCSAVGMLIGDFADEFAPSHEFVSRFFGQFTGRRMKVNEEHVKKWLAGYDLREAQETPYPFGAVVLLEDERGRYMGRGKVLRDRIRNMLPKK
jgi:16S rRNA (cytosine1407-C5)-methyltransferase